MNKEVLRPTFEMLIDDEIFIIGKGNQSLHIDVFSNSIIINTYGHARALIAKECLKYLLSLMNNNQEILIQRTELRKYISPWFQNLCVKSMPRRILEKNLIKVANDAKADFKLLLEPLAEKLKLTKKVSTDEFVSEAPKEVEVKPVEQAEPTQPEKVLKVPKCKYRFTRDIENFDEKLTELFFERKSVEEIGEILNLAKTTVKQHILRLDLRNKYADVSKKTISIEPVGHPDENTHQIPLKGGKIVTINYAGKLTDKDIQMIASHLKYLNEE
ncbi:hypothetical protein [Pseudomonas sp. NBRC 111121]|uniref:hypothetical protein n=1 Tax=Pseudomonas sp. NBRC 111121 TaxID=1661036 RepID=UPI0007614F83|nr:hypothetical protein [Pseudomonas sp. NBRC 111121]